VIDALGVPAARELLDVLERSDADRAALIGRLHPRDDWTWLAELLMALEREDGELVGSGLWTDSGGASTRPATATPSGSRATTRGRA